MSRWIDVIYKCKCFQKEIAFPLRERERTEDIEDFMNRVTYAIAADHLKRSPLCQATTMEYAKIPAADGIGVAYGGTA